MKTITIYGASDDLVEVRDVIGFHAPGSLSDEFSGGDDPTYVELSTGDVFAVVYGPSGIWRVTHHVVSGRCTVDLDIRPEPGEDEDPDPYTDTAKVTGPIVWVRAWPSWPPHPRDLREAITERVRRCNDAGLLARAWAVLTERG